MAFCCRIGHARKAEKRSYRCALPDGTRNAVVVFAIALAQQQLQEDVLRIACATVLFGFGVYKFFRARHPKWVGMRVNFKDLTIWSFLMASAHGAGLMLAPLLLRTPVAEASGHMHHAPASMAHNATMLLSAVGVHTLSFFVVMGIVAIIVYEVVGLACSVRRGLTWICYGLLL